MIRKTNQNFPVIQVQPDLFSKVFNIGYLINCYNCIFAFEKLSFINIKY
jgi:hypothetical protein